MHGAASERPRPRNALLLRSRLLYQFNSCGGGAVGETGAGAMERRTEGVALARVRMGRGAGGRTRRAVTDHTRRLPCRTAPRCCPCHPVPRPPSISPAHLALSCCGVRRPDCRGRREEGGRSLLPLARPLSVSAVERGSERQRERLLQLSHSRGRLASDVYCMYVFCAAPRRGGRDACYTPPCARVCLVSRLSHSPREPAKVAVSKKKAKAYAALHMKPSEPK